MREQPRRYHRTLPESYALGHFPTLELLRHRPERARRVIVHPKLDRAQREELERLADASSVPVVDDAGALERLAHKATIRAAGIFEKYAEPLAATAPHLLLYAPDNPGNLGSVLRTAAAMGVPDVGLIGGRADPWNPHVVRASLGARFLARCAVLPDLASYRAAFPHTLWAFAAGGPTLLQDAPFTAPFALLFGSEWPGLPPEARAAGASVRIPMAPGVESLGLPVAVGMALYEVRRRG